MKLWTKLAALGVLACFTTAYAQNAVCSDLVQQALTLANVACAPTGRNQACYGNLAMQATARDGAQNFTFDKQGDLANLADLANLQLQQLDLTTRVWGIALMKVQANLPKTLPGQNVTFLLFGDVKIQNDTSQAKLLTVDVTAGEASNARSGPAPQYRVLGSLAKGQTAPAQGRSADGQWVLIQVPNSNTTGWVFTGFLQAAGDLRTLPVVDQGQQGEIAFQPMQAFYFTTGIGQPSCQQAPDGLLIQTPKGQGEINLRANDVDIQLGSTAYLQAQPGNRMTVSVVEGQGKLTAQGKTVTVPAGMQATVPLDANLSAEGQPSNPQPYDAAALANLPLSLLPLQITVAPPLVSTPFPTWTRGPRPTVTLPVTPTTTEEPGRKPTAETSPTPSDTPMIESSSTPSDTPMMEPSPTPTTDYGGSYEPSPTPSDTPIPYDQSA